MSVFDLCLLYAHLVAFQSAIAAIYAIGEGRHARGRVVVGIALFGALWGPALIVWATVRPIVRNW
jgi:hypothetical protein